MVNREPFSKCRLNPWRFIHKKEENSQYEILGADSSSVKKKSRKLIGKDRKILQTILIERERKQYHLTKNHLVCLLENNTVENFSK